MSREDLCVSGGGGALAETASPQWAPAQPSLCRGATGASPLAQEPRPPHPSQTRFPPREDVCKRRLTGRTGPWWSSRYKRFLMLPGTASRFYCLLRLQTALPLLSCLLVQIKSLKKKNQPWGFGRGRGQNPGPQSPVPFLDSSNG